MKTAGLIIGCMLIAVSGCNYSLNKQESLNYEGLYHESIHALTNIMVEDIFSPPVASRIYAYSNIAAHEVLSQSKADDMSGSLAGQLNELELPPRPDQSLKYNFEIASIRALLFVGRALIFSEELVDKHWVQLRSKLEQRGVSKEVLDRSAAYGEEVGMHVLAWADRDMYKETRSFENYTAGFEPDKWKPTPPDYMEGIEPHWNKVRPFVLDSASQFTPLVPTRFSLEKNSRFYKELVEVYEVGNQLNEEEKAIAEFWDCNPYVSHHIGHVMYATKKITPGGHWIGITSIACKMKGLNLSKTIEAYTKVSVVMADAFISCWDEKWRSLLVRPETLINEYIDEEWSPLLQTPPFPEYPSGHSVVSAAASTMLTQIFGAGFEFDDTSELEYGLPVRSYRSFDHAAEEAAISRLYGGIHYMPAIENGVLQGKSLGRHIANQLN